MAPRTEVTTLARIDAVVRPAGNSRGVRVAAHSGRVVALAMRGATTDQLECARKDLKRDIQECAKGIYRAGICTARGAVVFAVHPASCCAFSDAPGGT